jgi:hypothetical protein
MNARRVSGAALLALWALTAPREGAAQAATVWGGAWFGYTALPLPPWFETRAQSFPLGPDLGAEKTFACSVRAFPAQQCFLLGWRPVGFTFGSRPDLARAITFSGDGRGRVIASTERDVIYSDDRGRAWQTAAWNGVVRPQIIAMDPDARAGVAVADGAIHVSDDAGASWRFVRELPGRRITQVVVAGRNAALGDGAGGLWALVAGSELTVLSESGAQSFFDGAPRLSLDGGAIVARDQAGHAMRVGRGGLVERSAPSTRWER